MNGLNYFCVKNNMNLLTPRALAEEISKYPAHLQSQVIAQIKVHVAETLSKSLKESNDQHNYFITANKQIDKV